MGLAPLAATPIVPLLAQERNPRAAAPWLEQIMPGRAATSNPMMTASITSRPLLPTAWPSENSAGNRQHVHCASGQATSSSSVQCDELQFIIAASSAEVLHPKPTGRASGRERVR